MFVCEIIASERLPLYHWYVYFPGPLFPTVATIVMLCPMVSDCNSGDTVTVGAADTATDAGTDVAVSWLESVTATSYVNVPNAPAVSVNVAPLWPVSTGEPDVVLYHSYVSPPDPEFPGVAVNFICWPASSDCDDGDIDTVGPKDTVTDARLDVPVSEEIGSFTTTSYMNAPAVAPEVSVNVAPLWPVSTGEPDVVLYHSYVSPAESCDPGVAVSVIV